MAYMRKYCVRNQYLDKQYLLTWRKLGFRPAGLLLDILGHRHIGRFRALVRTRVVDIDNLCKFEKMVQLSMQETNHLSKTSDIWPPKPKAGHQCHYDDLLTFHCFKALPILGRCTTYQ